MKNRFRDLLRQCIVPKVVFTGSKLSSKFQVKDTTIFSHNRDIICNGNCPENGCPNDYVGETARRISVRVLGHKEKISIGIFKSTLSRFIKYSIEIHKIYKYSIKVIKFISGK